MRELAHAPSHGEKLDTRAGNTGSLAFACLTKSSYPDLQHVVKRRLAVEQVDALQLDTLKWIRISGQRFKLCGDHESEKK